MNWFRACKASKNRSLPITNVRESGMRKKFQFLFSTWPEIINASKASLSGRPSTLQGRINNVIRKNCNFMRVIIVIFDSCDGLRPTTVIIIIRKYIHIKFVFLVIKCRHCVARTFMLLAGVVRLPKRNIYKKLNNFTTLPMCRWTISQTLFFFQRLFDILFDKPRCTHIDNVDRLFFFALPFLSVLILAGSSGCVCCEPLRWSSAWSQNIVTQITNSSIKYVTLLDVSMLFSITKNSKRVDTNSFFV